MKIVKAEIGYVDPISPTWMEEFEILDNEDAEEYLTKLIKSFNENRKKYEKERVIYSYNIIQEDVPKMYCDYEKVNLVTTAEGYDLLKCKICGNEFKRYGLATPQTHLCKKYLEANRKKVTNAFADLSNVIKYFKMQSWKQYNSVEHSEKIEKVLKVVRNTEV